MDFSLSWGVHQHPRDTLLLENIDKVNFGLDGTFTLDVQILSFICLLLKLGVFLQSKEIPAKNKKNAGYQ